MLLTRREFVASVAAGCVASQAFAASQAGSELLTRVELINGTTVFSIDGKPILRPGFETYVPQEKYFRQFAEAGTRLFMFNTNAAACDYGHSRETWVSKDTWDYSQFEELARAVLAACPNALLLPRVNLGTPRWWLEQHPEALELFSDGSTIPADAQPTLPKDRPFPSFASDIWREMIGDALHRFIDWVQQSEFAAHIFGYELTGGHTEEWYHWACGTKLPAGYSKPTLLEFQKWLRKKYHSEKHFRKAWARDDIAFDSAEIPTSEERQRSDGVLRDPATQQNVIDFYLFWNELIPETLDYFAQVAKKASHGKKCVGAFYGYMYEFAGEPEFGHNALGKFLRSPHLDFIAVTASYGTREAGTGSDYPRSPSHSVRLHQKLWYHDNDCVSFLAKAHLEGMGFRDDATDWTHNLSLQLRLLGYTDNAEKTQDMYRRGLGFALCNGMFQSWFDLHGGYFDDPELLKEIKRLGDVSEELAKANRSSIAEILVVSDETSCSYVSPRSVWLRKNLLASQNQLTRIGAPVDHVLLDDLGLLVSNPYKLVIFLNCLHISTQSESLINKHWKKDNRHFLWCSAAGFFGDTETQNPYLRMERLTGFKVKPNNQVEVPFELEQAGPSKKFENWTSFYTPSADMVAKDYRMIAKNAGVHIYNDQDDALYACRSLLCIHANGAGERVIHLPYGISAANVFGESREEDSGGVLRRTMDKGETNWYRLNSSY